MWPFAEDTGVRDEEGAGGERGPQPAITPDGAHRRLKSAPPRTAAFADSSAQPHEVELAPTSASAILPTKAKGGHPVGQLDDHDASPTREQQGGAATTLKRGGSDRSRGRSKSPAKAKEEDKMLKGLRARKDSLRRASLDPGAILFRTDSDGRVKTAQKIGLALKEGKSKLGSLSLYGTPYFIIVFVIAAITITVCQYVGIVYWKRSAEITTEFIPSGNKPNSQKYDVYKEELDIESPSSFLSDLSFTRYATMVLWITTVVTGLGAEAIMGNAMTEFASNGSQWGMIGWKYAQLLFSLFALISLFSNSVFGLPFLVVGLYKCGYPETLGFFLRAENIGRVNLKSISYFLQGMAVLIHHAAAAFVVCNVITGMYRLTRPLLAVVMPLIVQHWFALLKYENRSIHDLVCATLEVVFEWETFAHLEALSAENGFDMTCRGTALTMLVAHWMFLLSGVLDLLRACHICCCFKEDDESSDEEEEDEEDEEWAEGDEEDQISLREVQMQLDGAHPVDTADPFEEARSPASWASSTPASAQGTPASPGMNRSPSTRRGSFNGDFMSPDGTRRRPTMGRDGSGNVTPSGRPTVSRQNTMTSWSRDFQKNAIRKQSMHRGHSKSSRSTEFDAEQHDQSRQRVLPGGPAASLAEHRSKYPNSFPKSRAEREFERELNEDPTSAAHERSKSDGGISTFDFAGWSPFQPASPSGGERRDVE